MLVLGEVWRVLVVGGVEGASGGGSVKGGSG